MMSEYRGIHRSQPRRFASRNPSSILAGIFFLLAALVATVGLAQSFDDDELEASIAERYTVLPVQGGVLLTPREPGAFSAIEVREGHLAVDGREIELGELAARLGRDDSAWVAALADRDASELRALFGFEAPAGAREAQRALEESQRELQERLVEEQRERQQAIEDQMEDARRLREEALEEQIERLEEKKRAIAEEFEERSAEIRQRERERREQHRHSTGDPRVVVGSSVVVESHEEVGDVVAVGGSVTVRGEVDGDAVAIGGSADVDGEVSGGVVAVGGAVRLGNEAVVEGDVVSVGGQIHREPGARVEGQTTEVSMWSGFFTPWFQGWDWSDFEPKQPRSYFDGSLGELIGSLVRAIVLGVLGLLFLLFSRGRVERVARYAGAEPVKAGLVGFVALVGSVPLMFALAFVLLISIVGIPLILLLPFVALAFAILALFGYLSVAYQLGRWSEKRFGWRVLEPVAALVIGLLWLHGWSFMADIVDLVDGPRDFAGFLVLLLGLFGFLVKLCAWSVGLGAVLLSWGQPIPTDPVTLPPPPLPGGDPYLDDPYLTEGIESEAGSGSENDWREDSGYDDPGDDGTYADDEPSYDADDEDVDPDDDADRRV